MKPVLKLLAPYLAVIIFWCWLENAWLTILAYHGQILFWSHKELRHLKQGWNTKLFILTALPCLIAGPIVYFLIPLVTTDQALGEWLVRFGLEGNLWALMIPYFGLIHPILEQAHWGALRAKVWYAHPAFAAYHALVLYALLPPVWVLLCVILLCAVSIVWKVEQSQPKSGLLMPLCGHILADTAIVLAAYTRLN